ncbi:hypothetical protein BOX15_Mlig006169g1 [Macrostomum lignano]|uniref:Uncharacterized protein n=1 Tax=Macrostomum lignano TaxID=282301 RepID=A0A267FGR1_9PLAT|nr:hypothetical protein BOX15_Mlig006169g1 [Macrostomum lignano]
MSHGLFQCLSPAKEEGDAAQAADGRPRRRPQQRRSRSVVSVLLSLFRSESSDSPAADTKDSATAAATGTTAASATAAAGGSERRRRHHSAGSGKPPHSRMKLKRERCPKCHGVLPLKTPDLEPVLVRPGQARRRHEIKEDSGCIIAVESRRAADGARPAAVSCPEDSGNFSMSSGAGSSTRQPEPPLPLARPPMSGLYGTGFSTCVPRIPNRDAPVSNNCLPIRG